MKKLRSKLTRRKRSHFSPILKSSPKNNKLFTNATSSIITNDVTTTISCDSSTNNNHNNSLKNKKRTLNDVITVSDEFRRVTRSYAKRVVLETSIVSESSSCVVSLANSITSEKNVVSNTKSECSVFQLSKGVKVTEENDVVSYGVENSEVTSLFPAKLGDVNDVVSVSSVSPVKSTVNEGESAYVKVKVNDDVSHGKIKFNYGNNSVNDDVSGKIKFNYGDNSVNDINEGESAYVKVKVNDDVSKKIKFNYGNNSETVNNDINKGESAYVKVNDDVSEKIKFNYSVKSTVNEGESVYVKVKVNDDDDVSGGKINEQNDDINEGESSYVKVKVVDDDDVISKIKFNYGDKSVNDEQNEGESAYVKVKVNNDVSSEIKFTYGDNNCGESKLIPVDLDLTCSERLSDGYDDAEEDEETEVNMYSCSEIDFSSEFASSWYEESGSQFSEMSAGDTVPSPTFMLFVSYRERFCKSEFSRRVLLTGRDVIEASERIVNLLRPEDEEHEESYWMLKLRERRQLYVHDYSEEYCEMKEYGDLVVKQRLQMVHWIMEQAANKELQKETMFLGVSLLDRFLSKGYFRNKRELEIAGIACLTLATRIEENQPYNSIREKIFYVGNIRYSRAEVVAMEWLVQEVLKFQCYLPTIYNFLWFYLKAARANEDVDKIAKYLAVLALLGHEQLCYWPSTVAASLVILACLAENKQSTCQQITWIYDGSNDKDLPNCVKCMEWMLKCIT